MIFWSKNANLFPLIQKKTFWGKRKKCWLPALSLLPHNVFGHILSLGLQKPGIGCFIDLSIHDNKMSENKLPYFDIIIIHKSAIIMFVPFKRHSYRARGSSKPQFCTRFTKGLIELNEV